jgi:hypothetical protein
MAGHRRREKNRFRIEPVCRPSFSPGRSPVVRFGFFFFDVSFVVDSRLGFLFLDDVALFVLGLTLVFLDYAVATREGVAANEERGREGPLNRLHVELLPSVIGHENIETFFQDFADVLDPRRVGREGVSPFALCGRRGAIQ